jgi:hypothetical protein
MNATQYNIVFPLAKKDTYEANDTVDFVLSLENKKLVPGSLAICGDACIYKDKSTQTPFTSQDTDGYIDADAGYHSLFIDFTTEFRAIGLTESFSYYPRYVKMKTQGTMLRDSLGVETFNCIEGKAMNETIRMGLNMGVKSDDNLPPSAVPFVVKPDIAPNKSNVGIPGNQVGVVRIRCRLAPDGEVIYGDAADGNSGYQIKNLELRYETVDDDGSREPLTMEVYQVNRVAIETNNANLSTFVPGLCDAVHMSFIPTSDESDTSGKKNYLRCATITGTPILGSNASVTQGASRLYYAINDTDTALVGFTMQSRSEMLWNYLRSWSNEPKNYAAILARIEDEDAYGLGINFGSPLDFSSQQFAVEIDSNVSTAHSAYLYFRGTRTYQ